MRPKVHQKFSSCDMSVTVHSRILETEKLACESAVRSLEAQVAQIPQFRRVIDVERQKKLHMQKFFAMEPTTYSSLNIWIGPKKMLPSCKLAAICFSIHLRPPQHARNEAYIFRELEWMQMEENQPGSAATSSGVFGTTDTTLIEQVEPSSLVAAWDRLSVCPPHTAACPGDTQTSTLS